MRGQGQAGGGVEDLVLNELDSQWWHRCRGALTLLCLPRVSEQPALRGPQGQRELVWVVAQHWEALNTAATGVRDTPGQAQLTREGGSGRRSQRPGPLDLNGPFTSLPAWSLQ